MRPFLLIFLVVCAFHAQLFSQTTLEGVVKDQETADVVIGAHIKVLRNDSVLYFATTDLDGKFRLTVLPGLYDVQVSFSGMQPVQIRGIQVLERTANYLEPIILKSSSVIQEVIIEAFKVPLIKKDATSGGQTLTSEQISPLPKGTTVKAHERKKAKRSESSETKSQGVSEHSAFATDGIRVEEKAKDIATITPACSTIANPEVNYQPGQLTAGEWNDLHNWSKHFTQIYADGESAAAGDNWSLYPIRRFSLMLLNQQGAPLPNLDIALCESGNQIIWQGKTDQSGIVNAWFDPFQANAQCCGLMFSLLENGKMQPIVPAKEYNGMPQVHMLDRPCREYQDVDLMWVVDATGSMSDEMQYLQSELDAVMQRVKKNLPQAHVRTGAVFYRDLEEEYLIKTQTLSANTELTSTFIKEQYAAGGGDTPEAVDTALITAILHQPWNKNAIARICFLVLDASPHTDSQVTERLKRVILEAAKQGIRIVPVTASGITKDTEWLMKYLGILTNGTYVFLTDDSGIGEKHLEPTAEVYLVEKLNDLLVRLITEYATQADCNGTTALVHSSEDRNSKSLEWSFWPNPTTDYVHLQLPKGIERVRIYNMEGKLVQEQSSPIVGRQSMYLSTLADGFYLIQVIEQGHFSTGRLAIIRQK